MLPLQIGPQLSTLHWSQKLGNWIFYSILIAGVKEPLLGAWDFFQAEWVCGCCNFIKRIVLCFWFWNCSKFSRWTGVSSAWELIGFCLHLHTWWQQSAGAKITKSWDKYAENSITPYVNAIYTWCVADDFFASAIKQLKIVKNNTCVIFLLAEILLKVKEVRKWNFKWCGSIQKFQVKS